MTVEWVDIQVDAVTVHAVDESIPTEFVAKRTLGLGFWLSVGWMVLIVSLAILAPVLPLKDPRTNFTGAGNAGPNASPSLDHWFGTDEDALDVFSRTIWGARISLVVGFAAIAFGVIIGGSLGMISGFVRGWFDRIVSFVFVILLSFPALVLAILLTALLDRSLTTISLVLGVLAIAPVGRLARAATLVFAEREFVMAARTLGATNRRIMIKEILPNVVIPMSALALLGMAVAIVAEGALAFLSLSVREGTTWGNMIVDGSAGRTLEDAPMVALGPIIFLFLTVLSLNYMGDKLREYFDVRETSL